MLTTPHGHLKSSNVLLGDGTEPVLAEYGLSPVLNQSHAREALAAYISPEFLRHGRTTRKSDVWSLGVLILEVLSGKDPDRNARRRRRTEDSGGSSSQNGNGAAELVAWAKSLADDERGNEIFDQGMDRSPSAEKTKLLQIALACCRPDVGDRLDVAEAMKGIEELRSSTGNDEECSPSSLPQ